MLRAPPLALSVHLPCCVRKCPYGDFNWHAQRGALPFAAYVDALIADLDHDLPLAWGRTVHSVFFGGGTPSLFPPEAIDAFLQQASSRLRFAPEAEITLATTPGPADTGPFARLLPTVVHRLTFRLPSFQASSRLRFAPEAEITLETNPGTAEHGRFEGYRAAGVNRLSFGIQSFDDGCLQRLGRIHDSREAVAAVELARDAGFDNFNLDLMYALPGQTLAMAEDDVARAIEIAPTHVSHYQLTLEPNTK